MPSLPYRALPLAIVALLGAAACTPKGHLSPSVATKPASAGPISAALKVALDGANVQIQRDGSSRIPRRGSGPFGVVVTAPVTRQPFPGETTVAVLSSGERTLGQANVEFGPRLGTARLTVKESGTYRIEFWSGATFLAGTTFIANVLPTLDGQRSLELHPYATPHVFVTRAPNGSATGLLRWRHWDSIDADVAFIAEWWHDGEKYAPARGARSSFARDMIEIVQNAHDAKALADQPVWRLVTEQFPVPQEMLAANGTWELRIYRDDDHDPLSLSFMVLPDGGITAARKTPAYRGLIDLEISHAPVSKTATKQLAALPRQRPAPFTGE